MKIIVALVTTFAMFAVVALFVVFKILETSTSVIIEVYKFGESMSKKEEKTNNPDNNGK